MYSENILSHVNDSKTPILKKDLIKTKMFNVVLISLEKNQEILPHPEPYGVFFLVLQGSGIFTKKEGQYPLKQNSCIYYEQNELRGIKSNEKLVLLGIQDKH